MHRATTKSTFDPLFYADFYPDTKNIRQDNRSLVRHFKTVGRREGRIGNRGELANRIHHSLSTIFEQEQEFVSSPKKRNGVHHHKLNILIRTSSRPEYFKTCIQSILSQTFTNYVIYICYDTIDSLEYIQPYIATNKNIFATFIHVESQNKYRFNLYNNTLARS